MKLLLVLFGIIFLGCAAPQEQDNTITLPTLVEQSPLPVISESTVLQRFRFQLFLLVDETGEVKSVKFERPTPFGAWDSLATEVIRTWRYTPALADGKPIKLWLKQTVIVDLVEPYYVLLAEIVCQSAADASAAFDSLTKGGSFTDLAILYSAAMAGHRKGTSERVNINQYPNEIREALSRLKENEFTAPLKFGDKYIIFKRASFAI